jgi:glycosyltransferase involved in cell wall biosynthesis
MRILVFTTVYPSPERPLHGLFVQERIRHLARRAEVRVVAPVPWWPPRRAAAPAVEVREGLEVRHPKFFYVPRFLKALDGVLLFLSTLLCVGRLRRAFDFDAVDAHFGYPDGFAAALLGWWFRRPLSVTLRGTEPLIARHRLRRAALRWTLRRAALRVAVAAPLAEHARALAGRDVEVVPNGVDTARFAPKPRAEARSRLGLAHDRRLIVSVGHLSRRKGFQRVLRVLPELDADLAIVGGTGAEPSNEADLRRLARELRLERRVSLLGARPPAEVATWLNAADVFVLASDHEGCPNVVWEALACGAPVVATRVGEVERMVPAFAGILIDHPDDAAALRAALAAALGRAWDRDAIRAHAERHTWNGVAARLADLLAKVVGGLHREAATHGPHPLPGLPRASAAPRDPGDAIPA